MIPIDTANDLAELARIARQLLNEPSLSKPFRRRLEKIADDAAALVDAAWDGG